MSAHARFRADTTGAHERVDAIFSRFDLTDPASYGLFLEAHARALLPIEAALHRSRDLPAWRARTELVLRDLGALGRAEPQPLACPGSPEDAGLCGMLYVTEGSRLGGGMLARRVAPGLPIAYLSARHERGEWAALLSDLEARRQHGGDGWMTAALAGARQAFVLYGRAASEALAAA